MKWVKDISIGHNTVIDGFKVSRVICQNGTKHYYVHHRGACAYGSDTAWMSNKMYSLQTARKYIQRLSESQKINWSAK